ERLLKDGRLKGDERRLALAEHAPKLSPALLALRDKLLAACLAARFNLADLNTIDRSGRLKEVLQACVAEGTLVHIEGDFYLHADHEPELRRLLGEKLRASGKVTMSELRELLDTTRRSALPLAGYLDRIGLTRREGDYRVLAQSP
ncbi:MAG: SelB C-terminal domain-containing protein, partial [Gemmataceae bacterium]